MVQAFRRQEWVPKPRPPAATPIWREGAHEVRLRVDPECERVGRSFDRAFGARGGYRPPRCEVPDYLLSTDIALPKVAEAIKSGGSLNILVVGSRSSTINVSANTSEAAAYPGQMQAALKEKLPSTAVNVSVEIQPKKTAEEVAAGLPSCWMSKKPTLVVWQTGTVDAMRSVDPDDFRAAVSDGVVALQEAGADVILINPQYSPRTETMISAPPYLDNMRVVAQEHDVPLFDRFAHHAQLDRSPGISICSVLFMAQSSPSAFTIASGVRCRNLLLRWLIPSRRRRIEEVCD